MPTPAYREALVAEAGDQESILVLEHALQHAEIPVLLLLGRRHLDNQRSSLPSAAPGANTRGERGGVRPVLSAEHWSASTGARGNGSNGVGRAQSGDGHGHT